MADPGLLQALDYILNRSDEAGIEVIAEAVVRRQRNLSIFHAMGDIPDPQRMAKEITEKINTGVCGGIEGMRKSIQEMIIRIVREHAPELSDKQVEELCQAWLPGTNTANSSSLPSDVLLSMVEQFVSFSNGTMNESVDNGLRKEIGAWPSRYWQAFPPVVKQIITDYLKNKISEKEYKSKILLALGV
jgi:hypothetical protein